MAEIISVADPARIVDLHPVDQHERLRRLGAAKRYARHRSGAARTAEAHAGGGGEEVDDSERPAPLDRVGDDDSYRLNLRAAGESEARSGDDKITPMRAAEGPIGRQHGGEQVGQYR